MDSSHAPADHAPNQQEKLLTQLVPISLTSCTPLSLQPKFSCLSDLRILQSNHILPWGWGTGRIVYPFVTINPASHRLYGWLILSSANPMWHTVSSSPRLWVHMTNKLLSVSSVSGSGHLLLFKTGDPCFTNGLNRRVTDWSEQFYLNFPFTLMAQL